MTDKEAQKHLAKYLYFLMEEGVTAGDTMQRIIDDVQSIMKKPTMMIEVIEEHKDEN